MKFPQFRKRTARRREKRRRKYRLKPEARRMYQRILIILAAVGILALTMRLTVFKKTYTLGDYDMTKPFQIADIIRNVVKPADKEHLIVMDASMTVNSNTVITGIRLELMQLYDDQKSRSWELEISSGKAKLKKGDKVNENYAGESGRYPPLDSVLNSFSSLPLSKLSGELPIQEQQYYEFTTKAYRPDVNPSFSARAADTRARVMWVPKLGSASPVNAEWKAISDYMAVDCTVITTGKSKKKESKAPSLEYIYLLETKLA